MSQRPVLNTKGNPSERGFIMILTLLVLVVLTVLCMTALDNSSIEVKVAANDRQNRVAFHLDDGGLNTFFVIANESIAGGSESCEDLMTTMGAETTSQILVDERISLAPTPGEELTSNVNSKTRMADGFCGRLFTGDGLLTAANQADWELTVLGTGTVRAVIKSADRQTSPGGGLASHEGASGKSVASGTAVVYDVVATGLSARNTTSQISARFRSLIN